MGVIKNASLSLEITTDCNHNCLHCFTRSSTNKRGSLPLSLIRDILGEGCSLGYRSLHLTGGEPLLHEDFLLILESASKLGYQDIFFNTNGSLLDKDISQKLAEYRQNISLSISLHGQQVIHDKLCGEGAYKAALSGLEIALKNQLTVSIYSSVGRSLLSKLDNFADMLFDSFPAIKELVLLQMIQSAEKNNWLQNELLLPEDFIKMVKIITRTVSLGKRVSIMHNPLASLIARLFRVESFPESNFIHAPFNLIIMADQSVKMNHATQSFLGVYQSGSLQDLVKKTKQKQFDNAFVEICSKCNYKKLCSSNKIINTSEMFNFIHSAKPYCQQALFSFEKLYPHFI